MAIPKEPMRLGVAVPVHYQEHEGETRMKASALKVTVLGLAVIASFGFASGAAASNTSSTDQAPVRALGPSIEALEGYRLLLRESVLFGFGSADLGPEERVSLGALAKRLRNEKTIIEVRGYADDTESTEQNAALSVERAQAIRRLLIEGGVSTERILVLGLGAVDPAGPFGRPDRQRADLRVFQATDELSRSAVVPNPAGIRLVSLILNLHLRVTAAR